MNPFKGATPEANNTKMLALLPLHRNVESGYWASSLLSWRSISSGEVGLMALQFQQQLMKGWWLKSTSSLQECQAPGLAWSIHLCSLVSIALTYITSPVCVASCSSGSPRLLPQPHANHICELVSTISLSLSPSVIRVSGPGPVHPFCGMGLPSPYWILPF